MLKSVKIFIVLICISLLPTQLLSGCKGSDTREKVDDTVETLAGKKQVDELKRAEKQVSKITDQQEERFDQLEEEDSEEE
ncbi:MAG: hypothetical protein JXL81_11330, partial [Deltaproteobacteria bacterium]|nr:hypothetical protein [Deltaproteobacteria bacterium]